MSIDLEDSLSEFSYSLQGILDPIWIGREITIQDTISIKETIQERLAEHLFLQHPESYDFFKLASVFAYLGTEQRDALKNEVVQLFSTPNGVEVRGQDGMILPVKKGGASKFWKEHKTEIIIGIAVIATVVIVAACTGGSGAGATAAAGGAALNDLQDSLDKKDATSKKKPEPPNLAISEEELPNLFEPIDIVPPNPYQPPLGDLFPRIPNSSERVFSQEQTDHFPLPPIPFVPKQFLPEDSFPYEPPSFLKDFPDSREEEGPKLSPTVPEEPFPKATFFDSDTKPPPHLRLGKGSSIFQTTGKLLPKTHRIGMIPGINNLPENAYKHAERISGIAQGYRIEGVNNSTHSAPVDIGETFLLNYQGIPTPPSFLLKEGWEDFHKENAQNPQAKYLQICHSQGAAHVKNALLLCPEEIRDRVIVVAIAPAAIIPKDLCHDSYNYASKKDLIPYGELTVKLLTDPIKAVKDFKELKELIILEPYPDAKGSDHGFDSLTYEGAIKRHINDYLKRNAK